MRTLTVVLGLSFYALSIVQCDSQTSDSVSIPRAAWEQLESAIHDVAEAMRAISSAQTPTPTQKIEPTSQPPSTATSELAQGPDPPVTTSQVYLDRDCCERHRYRGCCERPRDRDCCESHRYRGSCEPHRDRDCYERPRVSAETSAVQGYGGVGRRWPTPFADGYEPFADRYEGAPRPPEDIPDGYEPYGYED